jgi:hypothetical protein
MHPSMNLLTTRPMMHGGSGMAAEKIDLSKAHKELFRMGKGPFLVKVPELKFLMVDGEGDPNGSQRFQAAVESLYGLAYSIKFISKAQPGGVDFKVMPLEGLWWASSGNPMTMGIRADWQWTLMIMVPDFLNEADLRSARTSLERKKPELELDMVRLETFEEGLSAQILHVGPYTTEGPTIEGLHEFIMEKGYEPHGKHHEIYMSDPRRTVTDAWKTLIRHPVRAL